ncbi:MAG: 30S ribosomal protein S16 [Chloroflexota bacterium]
MLRIRLARVGKKKQAHFRVVVADIESKRDGRIVERIGHYSPLTDPATFKIDEGRALHWLSVGAQPTEAVSSLLKRQGTLKRLKRLHAGETLEDLVAEFEGAAEEEVAEPQAVAEAEAVAAEGAEQAAALEEE